MAARARDSQRSQSDAPKRRSPAERVGDRPKQQLRVGRHQLGRGPRRIEPRAVGIDEHLRDRGLQPRGRDLAREARRRARRDPGGARRRSRARAAALRRSRSRTAASAAARWDRRARASPRPRRSERRWPAPPAHPTRERATRADVRTSSASRATSAGAGARVAGVDTVHGRPSGRPGASTSGEPVGTSGSRNGRFKCTGPAGGPSDSATARHASERHTAPTPGSSIGGPGSQNQRTASP